MLVFLQNRLILSWQVEPHRYRNLWVLFSILENTDVINIHLEWHRTESKMLQDWPFYLLWYFSSIHKSTLSFNRCWHHFLLICRINGALVINTMWVIAPVTIICWFISDLAAHVLSITTYHFSVSKETLILILTWPMSMRYPPVCTC